MNISDLQAQRKAAEREPIDWKTYRAALIGSGMVEEARRSRELPRAIAYFTEDPGAKEEALIALATGDFEVLQVRPRTLVDELYLEKHGSEAGVGPSSEPYALTVIITPERPFEELGRTRANLMAAIHYGLQECLSGIAKVDFEEPALYKKKHGRTLDAERFEEDE
jgi:hypothetical protein